MSGRGKTKTARARLLKLVESAKPTLFHTETREAFARVKVGYHFENLAVYSAEFEAWLKVLSWGATKEAVTSETIETVRGTLAARAQFDGPEHRLHNRVAWHEDAIWYDLADSEWRAIRVSADGWQLASDVPILFRRYSHQQPQLVPDPGGRLSEAEPFLNLRTAEGVQGHVVYDQRYLFLIALISYLVPDIPHPIVGLHGEHGSAKTTISKIARKLIDPSVNDTLGEPTREGIGQLFQHHYLLPFDNMTWIPGWLSDALCRAVTGDGLSKRRLYTDEGDVVFAYRRCILLNGINTLASRPDLLDRSILFECEMIPPDRRLPERDFWKSFADVRARIFGAILNTLSAAMRIRPTLKLDKLPRMADFAEWGCAIAEACGWGCDAFLSAYATEAASRNLTTVDSSVVAQALIDLVSVTPQWEGTAVQLLHDLETAALNLQIDTHGRDWPRQPHVLSRRVNEVAPNLRRLGIRVTHGWRGSQRIISIVRS